jgi:hypothetical protein
MYGYLLFRLLKKRYLNNFQLPAFSESVMGRDLKETKEI